MRRLIVVIAVLCWLGVMPSLAQACSCAGPGTPCDSYGSAAAVFAGTVIGIRELERPKPEDKVGLFYRRAFKFSVEQSYLGISGTEVEIVTGRGGGDCGYSFRMGGRYLVYAYRSQNQLATNICSRTKPFADANEDLAFLGNLSSAAPGATIYGQIVADPTVKTELASIASDALIIIEGNNVRREVRPDADGRYRVSGLPAGKFKVTLKLPETLITYRPEREVTVADRGCAMLSYDVTDNDPAAG